MTRLPIIQIIIIFALIGVISGLFFVRSKPATLDKISIQTSLVSSEKKVEEPQVAQPQTLLIPKLGVNAAVEPVGEDSIGRMDVPKRVDDVGWYNLGYKPGEKGSAVIDGHFDTITGAPAVFYYIGNLTPGDQVIVIDKNGKNLTFEVTSVQSYPFDQLPLQEVFASNDKPRLNLITCTGTWNVGSRNYSNRLVVYTELI